MQLRYHNLPTIGAGWYSSFQLFCVQLFFVDDRSSDRFIY